MTHNEPYTQLQNLDREIRNLDSIAQLLSWDQETGMPPTAVTGRAEQISLIEGMVHDRVAGEEMASLLEGADTSDPLIRMLRREHDRAVKLPRRLVTELARQQTTGQLAWRHAKQENNYEAFRPYLEELLKLTREKADAIGWEDDRYDALLDEYEPWMKSSTVDRLFDEMSSSLSSLLARILDKKAVDDSFLFLHYPEEGQRRFSREVSEAMGFDFSRGAIAESVHPFTIRPGDDDIRITTKYDEGAFKTAIFGTIHETGHALYEQGVAPSYVGTILGQGSSHGIHESQSRTWENIIGRGAAFWRYFYPRLQSIFPENLSSVPFERFLLAVNKVKPSDIRTEADEVTYGLHIVLRYRLERKMLSGDLPLRDLPEAWNALSEELLGFRPETDAVGVLQDTHWSGGAFGYFPTYALGNLYGAQIFAALRKDVSDLDAQIAAGHFHVPLSWLTEKVYRHGAARTANELMTSVTGEPVQASYFARYLEEKYTGLYGL